MNGSTILFPIGEPLSDTDRISRHTRGGGGGPPFQFLVACLYLNTSLVCTAWVSTDCLQSPLVRSPFHWHRLGVAPISSRLTARPLGKTYPKPLAKRSKQAGSSCKRGARCPRGQFARADLKYLQTHWGQLLFGRASVTA